MKDKVVLFDDDGVRVFFKIDKKITLEDLAKKVVPDGVPYWFVDEDDLPEASPATWDIPNSNLGSSGGYPVDVKNKIKVDRAKVIDKAREDIKRWATEYMNDVARSMDYSGIADLISYASSKDDDAHTDFLTISALRDKVRAFCNQLNDDIKTGAVMALSRKDFFNRLPDFQGNKGE